MYGVGPLVSIAALWPACPPGASRSTMTVLKPSEAPVTAAARLLSAVSVIDSAVSPRTARMRAERTRRSGSSSPRGTPVRTRRPAPMVLRMPVGFLKCGDPWHSQTNEIAFIHNPGWQVAVPSNAEDAVGLLRGALRGNDPVLFFEHRAMLDDAWARRPWPGDDYVLLFGHAKKTREGDSITIVTWGAMVPRCEEAVRQAGVSADVIDRMVDYLDARPDVGCATARVVLQDGRRPFHVDFQHDPFAGRLACFDLALQRAVPITAAEHLLAAALLPVVSVSVM